MEKKDIKSNFVKRSDEKRCRAPLWCCQTRMTSFACQVQKKTFHHILLCSAQLQDEAGAEKTWPKSKMQTSLAFSKPCRCKKVTDTQMTKKEKSLFLWFWQRNGDTAMTLDFFFFLWGGLKKRLFSDSLWNSNCVLQGLVATATGCPDRNTFQMQSIRGKHCSPDGRTLETPRIRVWDKPASCLKYQKTNKQKRQTENTFRSNFTF